MRWRLLTRGARSIGHSNLLALLASLLLTLVRATSYNASIFGDVEALVPSGAFAGGPDCIDLYPALQEARCSTVGERDGVNVLHCPRNSSAGLFLLDAPQYEDARPNVYKIRLVGPEVLALTVHYCSQAVALAPYQLYLSGTYHAEVDGPHS